MDDKYEGILKYIASELDMAVDSLAMAACNENGNIWNPDIEQEVQELSRVADLARRMIGGDSDE